MLHDYTIGKQVFKKMRIKEHIGASAAISIGIYAATGSGIMAAWSFLAGSLLDLDHLIDYWEDYSFNIDISRFISVCYNCQLIKTRLYLHSFELLLVAAAAAYITRSSIIAGAALGLAQHIALDQMVNKVYPASYFLIYRWRKGFYADFVFRNVPKRVETNGNYKKAGAG